MCKQEQQQNIDDRVPLDKGELKGDKSVYLDDIPESRAARWAYRFSFIPLLGIPLFMFLGFIALFRMGSIGQTGTRPLSIYCSQRKIFLKIPIDFSGYVFGK